MKRSDFLIVLGAPGGGPSYSIEPTEGKVAAIKDAIDYPEVISGFTLFETKNGWQMSIRPKDESGWKVEIIPTPMAQRILLALETDPRFVEAGQTIYNALAELIAANKAAREALTAALRAWRP
jgi:hypothetical protein